MIICKQGFGSSQVDFGGSIRWLSARLNIYSIVGPSTIKSGFPFSNIYSHDFHDFSTKKKVCIRFNQYPHLKISAFLYLLYFFTKSHLKTRFPNFMNVFCHGLIQFHLSDSIFVCIASGHSS